MTVNSAVYPLLIHSTQNIVRKSILFQHAFRHSRLYVFIDFHKFSVGMLKILSLY
jgi:hypothetical protein